MNDNYLKKRTPQERLIIAKTLLETVLDDMRFAQKVQLPEEDATKDATSDLISRKDAIDEILGLTNCDTVDELRAYVKGYDLGSWWSGGVLSSVGKVERLPSAEKTQLPEEDATKDATSDLISKKEATTIPVMPKEHREYQTMNLDDAYEQGWFDCQKCIEELPSAEPKTPSNGSITCVKSEKMHDRTMGDLISRQGAIDARCDK